MSLGVEHANTETRIHSFECEALIVDSAARWEWWSFSFGVFIEKVNQSRPNFCFHIEQIYVYT